MLWEYTDDYGLLKLDRSTTPPTIATTKRFHFMSPVRRANAAQWQGAFSEQLA